MSPACLDYLAVSKVKWPICDNPFLLLEVHRPYHHSGHGRHPARPFPVVPLYTVIAYHIGVSRIVYSIEIGRPASFKPPPCSDKEQTISAISCLDQFSFINIKEAISIKFSLKKGKYFFERLKFHLIFILLKYFISAFLSVNRKDFQ